MNLTHDKEWLLNAFNSDKYDVDVGKRIDPLPFSRAYHEHMQRFIPASEWHDDDGDVLWYRLPVAEPPYVGSPLDVGWDDEPFAILLNGETRDEYFTHFQHIYTPEH